MVGSEIYGGFRDIKHEFRDIWWVQRYIVGSEIYGGFRGIWWVQR